MSAVLDCPCNIGHIPNNSKFFADFNDTLNLEMPKRLILKENRPEGMRR
jgi:hypothetical protein